MTSRLASVCGPGLQTVHCQSLQTLEVSVLGLFVEECEAQVRAWGPHNTGVRLHHIGLEKLFSLLISLLMGALLMTLSPAVSLIS